MKTFFAFFFTLHWWKAARSLFNSPELMAFDDFDANEPEFFHILVNKGFSRKEILKGINYIRKHTVLDPIEGFPITGNKWEKSTPEEFTEFLINAHLYKIIYVGKKVSKKLYGGQDETQVIKYGPFTVKKMDEFRTSPMEDLEKSLYNSWQSLQQDLGKIPKRCGNCGDRDLYINEEGRCGNCGEKVETFVKRPKSARGLLKDIVESRDKQIVFNEVDIPEAKVSVDEPDAEVWYDEDDDN